MKVVSRWAAQTLKSAPAVHPGGARTSLVALVAKAPDLQASAEYKPTQQIEDLHGILLNNWIVREKPKMFCFSLLEHFNMRQLETLASGK